MRKVYDAVICGYYGYENAGDDAVLGVIISEIKRNIPEAKIGVLASRKENYIFDVEFIDRYNAPRVIKALHGAGVFIFGGGTLLQNSSSRRSLIYYCSVIALARVLCKKVIIFANGIGKIKKNGDKLLTLILKKAHKLSFRDPVSYAAALKMGADANNTFLRADPVFLMEHRERKAVGLPEKYFAVSLRKIKNFRGENEIIEFCKRKSEEGLKAVFIPMQEKYDGEICRSVAKMCNGMVLDRLCPENIVGVLEGAQFAVGMRLHFLLLAQMQSIPTVSLSYDVKISSTMPYVGEAPLIALDEITADNIEKSLIKAKNTDRQKFICRCDEMRKLALEDINMLAYEIAEAAPERDGCPVEIKLL